MPSPSSFLTLVFFTSVFPGLVFGLKLSYLHSCFGCFSSPASCNFQLKCADWLIPTEKVNFTLYYETLCPDCQSFIVGQLYKAFNKISPLMNLEFIPFGNAQEIKTSKGYKFICQHGPKECQLNKIETCAIKKLENSTHSMLFIHGLEHCLMKKKGDFKCVKAMCLKYGLSYKDLMTCATGPDGVKYEHEMAVKTKALNPPNEYVPWVTINGVHTEEIQKKAEKDLTALICDTYQGSDKSKWCPTDLQLRFQKGMENYLSSSFK